jgi:hypothetical protein
MGEMDSLISECLTIYIIKLDSVKLIAAREQSK